MPSAWNADGYAFRLAPHAAAHHHPSPRRTKRHEVHLVLAVGPHPFGTSPERHRHRHPRSIHSPPRQRLAMLRLHNRVHHRRHRAVGHNNLRPLGLEPTLVAKAEKALVQPRKEIALCQMHRQALRPQPHAQHTLQLRRQLVDQLEQQAVALLLRRARIAHIARTRPQAPLPAPLVTNHRAHRTAESIVNTIALFCHNVKNFKC